jgi:hypothetical protein
MTRNKKRSNKKNKKNMDGVDKKKVGQDTAPLAAKRKHNYRKKG